MLNTGSEEYNVGFYSYLVWFLNTFTLNMYLFLSNSGLPRRLTRGGLTHGKNKSTNEHTNEQNGQRRNEL